MDFKDLYDKWLDQNGGLVSAISKSYAAFNSDKKDDSITTQKVTTPFFKRGSFYVFDYMDPQLVQKVMTTDTVPFFDGHPFIFALDHDKQYQYGLNLNILPMDARILLYTLLYKVCWDDIDFNIGKEYNRWREMKRIDRSNIAKLVRMKSDIAINKYDVSLIKKVKAIEWESAVPASTLYIKHNIIFNKKKNLNMQTLWKMVF